LYLESKSKIGQTVIFLERGQEGLEGCGTVQLLGRISQTSKNSVIQIGHRSFGGKSAGDRLEIDKMLFSVTLGLNITRTKCSMNDELFRIQESLYTGLTVTDLLLELRLAKIA
jgi:hypothetical protein